MIKPTKSLLKTLSLLAIVFTSVISAQDDRVDDATVKNFVKKHLPMLQRDLEAAVADGDDEDAEDILLEAKDHLLNFEELKKTCGNEIADLSIKLINMDDKCIDLASDYADAKEESDAAKQKDVESSIKSLVKEMFDGLLKLEKAKLAAIEKNEEKIRKERLKWFLEYFDE